MTFDVDKEEVAEASVDKKRAMIERSSSDLPQKKNRFSSARFLKPKITGFQNDLNRN